MNSLVKKTLYKLSKDLLFSNIIFDDTEDGYVFFNLYYLQVANNEIKITRFRDEKVIKFNSVKNATAWIVLDKHNKFYEANRLLELDIRLCGVLMDKKIHQNFLKNKKIDLETYYINLTKLDTDLAREKQIIKEIDKYIILANLYQQKGFENELKRYV